VSHTARLFRAPVLLPLAAMTWAVTLGSAAATSVAPPTAIQAPAGPAVGNTVWDRPFSEAQAVRGQAAFNKSCTVCHRDDLGGSGDGPPLRGLDFFIRWRGQTVAEMLDEIQMTMPISDPGSLPTQTYLDIMSFLFAANGVPLGTADLPAERETLTTILITEKPAN
jgi:hypothetical protein